MNILLNLTAEQIQNGIFPLNDVLTNSFYYPSCGFDGGIIKDCNTIGKDLKISSFIYCDYATGEDAFRSEQNTFVGYNVLGGRSVTLSELTPNGWRPELPPNINRQEYLQYQSRWKPFAYWTIYERNTSRGEDHGPQRFSLLYIGGEGVATFQALYWSNNVFPRAVAIIQPGTGFGLNWTDFKAKDGALAWVVNHNPSGTPHTIYYGGYGQGYSDFDWPGFSEERTIYPYYNYQEILGEVRVWKRT